MIKIKALCENSHSDNLHVHIYILCHNNLDCHRRVACAKLVLCKLHIAKICEVIFMRIAKLVLDIS